ncbi:MAG: hypothetical protein Q8N53_21640 [Longimicrobiales bacterium]|nr:hypothetical protein [Longimicrobiales bacterium]
MRWLAPVALGLAAACALPAGAPGTPAPDVLPPPGFGTLRQDEVSVALASEALQIKVTPLAESVTLATAPDTYRRLSGLTGRFGPEAVRSTGADAPALFLVSFYSESPDVSFVPEELQLIARGVRLRPGAILPVTPGWGQRRLQQRETEVAVYAFADGVDLESDLVVAYGLVESGAWAAILPRVQAERARAAARARGEGR